MLILFDVDATLISTSGVGMRAMEDAGRELLTPSFSSEGITFAGNLDPLIIADIFSKCGHSPTPERTRLFRACYRAHLERRLAQPGVIARALPGVSALLDTLLEIPGAAIGLLTGNFAETGRMKLSACGLDADRFHLHVWGDDSTSDPPRRDDLPGVALAKYRERFDRGIEPSRVVVVGDTPHDISCARAHGCRSLAVATGHFTAGQLLSCGATRVVKDLSETADIVAWMSGGIPAA